MEIEEKYLKLLWLLIRDKRNNMSGIITSLQINRSFGGYYLSYGAFMNRQNQYPVYLEDIECGNVVFILPFGVDYRAKEMEEMAKRNIEAIKEFFGDKFRDDMIMRISEEDRQEEIRKWESLTIGLENWENKYYNDKEKEERNSYCIVTINRYLPFPVSIQEIFEGPFQSEKAADYRLGEIIKEKLKSAEKIGMKEKDFRDCYKVVSLHTARLYAKRK